MNKTSGDVVDHFDRIHSQGLVKFLLLGLFQIIFELKFGF